MTLFKKKSTAIALGVFLLAAAGTGYYLQTKPAAPEPLRFRLAPVERGDITQMVTASGTINPLALINIGSQVSGTVTELRADFNDQVKKGAVLLKLDPTIFNAQVHQAQAQLASARASLQLAQASHARNQSLVAQSFISTLALDQSKREVDVAEANVQLALAQFARAQADLDNSVIRSPIDGVIIKRSVDLGQTVAASFTTPTLFQIAQDLTKMQIHTNVSEADVGALQTGQAARFVVDAYPDKEFDARMHQFRLAANVLDNVVTYNVVLDVDNHDELLKPGMTAQVSLIVGQHRNVLRIPTAALRFHLSDEEEQKRSMRSGKANAGKTTDTAPDDDASMPKKNKLTRVFKIYTLDADKQPLPIDIAIGLSNFRYTEVLSKNLKVGDQVIVRALKDQAAGDL
ncbi:MULTISPECIES: efflux RND transporter periplasmic adaptor subunit [unclassified Undibacterium]|uniref:efflux RND transporter periplasmic adaptor subunit n=1 Tax=unclassified Undibacterium TaxID=2630295 RepID=UPI002AC90A91|nr:MULTISPECIES: efflux RND transporter periplasmic adaptor subunit [unclassified Undibacterium]MEB0140170.1 efflux RND transporter periplasmic adaptor subunit [Undibacterium sp. CCC2.1]MEB0172456.1 efflux RND transporter periplasmic adaptor subunit [Undibacterium sp. CCC1.1]MEB0176974.1 efflux RND transporter periplasmic adaptor subunit [Undibacterium sp. CCC3.4]MEB0215578.1 efflux RND transporter periplasmic adaptor subunit [Undibacterium sp. 5I2]WPX43715.1 efflux RND transporter periplasmic